MPNETYTTGKLALDMPNTGSYVNEWAAPLAANWQVLDAAVSGTTSITLSNSDVALTVPIYPLSSNPAASPNNPVQNLRILLLGTLTANVSVILPARVPGMWLVDNQTSGSAFSVTVKTATSGSVGVQPPRGYISFIWTDGTNVAYADGGGAVTNAAPPPVATDTVNGIVTQGLLPGNCVNLNTAGKTPYQTDKYIISTTDPVASQGDQNWLWFKV